MLHGMHANYFTYCMATGLKTSEGNLDISEARLEMSWRDTTRGTASVSTACMGVEREGTCGNQLEGRARGACTGWSWVDMGTRLVSECKAYSMDAGMCIGGREGGREAMSCHADAAAIWIQRCKRCSLSLSLALPPSKNEPPLLLQLLHSPSTSGPSYCGR